MDDKDSICSSSIEDPQPNCSVCSDDRDIGLHYGIPSCFGCKAFFRRTVRERKTYVCSKDGRCVVDKKCRNQCRACRYEMCIRKGMLLTEVREDRKPEKVKRGRKAVQTTYDTPSPANPVFPQMSTTPGVPNFINFLSSIDQSLEHLYDPAFDNITVADVEKLNDMYGRHVSLEEGLQKPDLVCPRTKFRWDCERVFNTLDVTFVWYRGFVAIADWTNGFPQFRQLSLADKAQLFRLNFLSSSFMFFLQYSALEVGFAMGNGAYIPHDAQELRKNGLGNQLVDTVTYRYKTEIFPPLINLDIDQRELGVLKAILFFNGDASLSAEAQRTCDSIVSSIIEAWFEYQKLRFPDMSTIQLVKRQSQILLVIPKIMHVWQSEHDVYLMYTVFHGMNLDGIPMELINNRGLKAVVK
ncbi:hypothetical protein QR680_001443 [Steinernema hermaphroditum]|uniref:Nuclear receptor domain-containing protein n=1 Tax=Steinernema hermaphroditum TaxID=289476 RepID=A0AA39GZ70_9BILA|nr:hypothetical protein QR680_001443 [Steinernema hermaphroditum]